MSSRQTPGICARWTLLIGLATASACGGGGGGGTPSPTPTPTPTPTPPPDNSSQPLTITASNAFDVAYLAIAVPESLIQLLLSMVNHTVALYNAHDALTLEQPCLPGDATVSLLDRDDNSVLSNGDRVTLRFSGGCSDHALNDRVTGEMAAELDTVTTQANGDLALVGQLIITEPLWFAYTESGSNTAGVRVSGRFGFTVVAAAGEHPEVITISHRPDQPLVITLVDEVEREFPERVRAFSVRRELFRIDHTRTGFRFDFDFTHESSLLDGRFHCATTAALTGQLRDSPNDGEVACRGAGAAEVSIVGLEDAVGATADVRLDLSGGGSPVSIGFPPGSVGGWDDLSEGVVFRLAIADIVVQPSDEGPPHVHGLSVNAAVNDAVYDSVGDRIYVSNAAGIVVLDARTLAVTATVTVPGTPGVLALSDDGSVLWFAHDDDSWIQALSTADLSLSAPVPLGIDVFAPRVARELAVVPGRPDTVVATMHNGRELIAYQGGAEMAGSLWDSAFTGLSRIAFRDAESVIVSDDGSTAFTVRRIRFDPTEGLTLTRTLPGLADGFGAGLHLGNQHFFTDRGQIFNEIAETVEGALPRGGNILMIDRVAIDGGAGRVYALSLVGPDTINVYRESPLALTATYRISAPPGPARRLLITPHSLVVATGSGLLRLDLADLGDNLAPDPCAREDLSGLVAPGRYVQLRCPFHDAVYDSARHRLYASVPGVVGPSGNSIAIIDASQHTIASRISIGVDAESVVLSPDSSLLFGVTSDASKLTVIDVTSEAVDSHVRLGFRMINDDVEWRPNHPRAVAVSALDPREVLVTYWQRGVELFQSGVRAPRRADFTRDYQSLFLRSDSRLAAATGFSHTGMFTVDSDGVTLDSETTNLLPGTRAAQRGDLVFSSLGAILDLTSLTGVSGCFSESERGMNDGVAPDPESAMIYYVSAANPAITVQGCDLANGERTEAVTYLPFGGSFGTIQGLRMAGSGQLAVVFDDRILFIDAPTP